MEIVIDIDENVFTRLFDNGTDFYDTDDILAMAKAIRKGTPLKGHGRLKDENEIKGMIEKAKVNSEYSKTFAENIIRFAPTIIEADKESEEV